MATASRQALDWVVRHIRDNKLEVGDLLPSEIELTERLSIGRSSIREAFAVLRSFGVVRSKPGVGPILIADYRQLDLMSLFAHDHFELEEYMAFRQLRNSIELGSAELILRRITEEQTKELRRLTDEIRLGKESKLAPMDFEIQFHELLAAIAGNRYAIALSLLYRPMFEYHTNHRLSLEDKQSMPPEIVATHERIVDALENRDLDELVQALRGEWTESVFMHRASVER